MLVRLNAAEFVSIPQKNLHFSFDEILPYAKTKYRAPGLASIMRFQIGCH